MSGAMHYTLFAGRDLFHNKENEFRNQVFNLWNDTWQQVYQSSNSGYHLYADEFTRQDLIGAITIDGQVAAVHLYSFFDLSCDATMKMKYFDFFNENYWKTLKSRGVKNAMTMEFLTVNPKFRRKEIGIHLGKVITQTGGNLFNELGLDAIIAPARNDLKVNELAYDLGFSCIEANTIQRGFECDLIACFKGDLKSSSDPDVALLGAQLWENRTVLPSAKAILGSQKQDYRNSELAA